MGTLGTRARNGKKPAPRRAAAANGQHPAVAKLAIALSEHKEALEQQAATAEILRALSRSSSDLQPVFEAIVEHAHRLCAAVFSILYGYDGKLMTVIAHRVNASASRALRTLYPAAPRKDHIVGRAILEGRVMHSSDVLNDPRFRANRNAFMKAMPFRAGLEVPLLRNGAVLGVIAVGRLEPKPFSKKEIGLLRTFADQAVIAIQNATMFREIRDRNAELKQALDFQGASGAILTSISNSVTDSTPVFDAIAGNTQRLLDTNFVAVSLLRNDHLELAAAAGDESYLAQIRAAYPWRLEGEDGVLATRAVRGAQVVHMCPIGTDPGAPAKVKRLAKSSGYDSILLVPMLRQGVAIGLIATARTRAIPFDDKQIALIKAFADQAVIAIENARLFNETKEALEQQTATGEILRVISGSPTDLTPVFDAILKSAMQLCEAHLGILNLYDGEWFRTVAQRGGNPQFAQWVFERGAFKPDGGPAHQAIAELRAVQIADAREGIGYRDRKRNVSRFVDLGGVRTFLAVPLLKDGKVIGHIGIYRPEVRPFTEKQVALVSLFANQAVIAIENVRLFNETKEALEHQKASADILRIVAGSVEDIDPVFQAITEAGMRLVPGSRVGLLVIRDGQLHHASHSGIPQDQLATLAKHFPAPLDRQTIAGASILDSRVIQITDIAAEGDRYPRSLQAARASGDRSLLVVPLLHGANAVGSLSIRRAQPGAFTDKQVGLARTFADQAVIAIRNARLFNETKEALEHQKASADILRIVADSVENTDPVFEAITSTGMRLIPGVRVSMLMARDGQLHYVSHSGVSDERRAQVAKWFPIPLDRDSVAGTCIIDRRVMHVADIAALAAEFPLSAQTSRASGARAMVAVPLVHAHRAIGAIIVSRDEPGAFADKQIALAKTFADQAVIAIRNARMFRETQEALERQTATAEILKVIASSPSDVQPVFDAIAKSALRLIGGTTSAVTRVVDGMQHLAAFTTASEAGDHSLKGLFPARIGDLNSGRAITTRAPAYRIDTENDPDIPAVLRANARARGYRSILAVPMLRDGVAIGAISVSRAQPGAFSSHQIGLLSTFADQAVIAIENVRLFNETKEALERQTATSEVLRVISGTPADAQPVFDAIVQSLQRLMAGNSAALLLRRESEFFVASYSAPGLEAMPAEVRTVPLDRDKNFPSRVILDGEVLHIPDWEADEVPEHEKVVAKAFGFGSGMQVPLLRDGRGIGALVVTRQAKGPFHEKEIALLRSFADQAVIAIENSRLFNETKEALEQQTGTSQVLSAISGSPTDVAPVYETILDNATRLCEASFAVVFLYDGEYLRAVAQRGASAAFAKHLEEGRLRPSRETATRLAALERRIVQVEDLLNDPHFAPADAHRAENARAVLSVPMLREGALIGVLTVWRREPRRFSDKQVALLKTFADQAVIAIENVRLFNETKEALERQTASADILRVISSTPTDTQPVFNAIVHSAQRLVSGKSAVLLLRRETDFFVAAYSIPGLDSLPPEVRTAPLDRDKNYPSRVMLDGEIVHVPDWEADDVIEFEKIVGKAYGIGSGVEVPLLRKGEGVGALAVTRQTKGPFSEKEIALLQSFADQAVIAIENVRLFNETKEALEQQTAISEVLRVISDSPTDVKPVLDAVAVRAAKICDASDARIWLVEGDSVRHVAGFGDVPMPIGLGEALPLDRGTVSGRAILDCAPVHVEDMAKLTREDYPISREMQERSGFRTILSVPLMREQRSLGAIMLRRLEVRSFTDKQIALLKTFADQAAIAIENVRLFNETKEALERQTATAEILRVISASPTDVQPVFDAIVQAADRLCDGRLSTVLRFDGESLDLVAHHNLSTEGLEAYRQVYPQRVSRNTMAGRALLDRKVINITDSQDDPDIPPQSRAMAVASGFRSVLVVPMLREGEPIGVLNIARAEPGSFSQAQVELLKTFADQAVIAIENVRLFNETKEALEQQTAISEILRVISDSPADVQPVVDAVAARAGRICDASDARIFLVEGETLRHAAGFGDVPMIVPLGDAMPLNRGSAMGRAVIDRAPVHVDDMQNQSADEYPQGRKIAEQAGWHTVLAVPLLREGRSLGAMVLRRMEVRSFSDKQIALLRTFADQAAIAIENVRLFNETKEALERQTATAEILKVISDSPIDVQPVFEAILARAAALCNASFGNVFRYDGAMLEMVACNLPAASIEILRKDYPSAPSRGKVSGRVVLDRQVMEIPDVLDDPEYQGTAPKAGGHRSLLGVPLLREGRAIGAIVIARHEPGRFTPRQVAMVQTFADQAVIAIENVRLFKELQARTEALSKSVGQLTALGEVGQAISSTLDLETVLSTIVARSVQLTGLDSGAIYEYDEGREEFHLRAAENMSEEIIELLRKTPIKKGDGAVGGTAVLREPVQIPEIQDESYRSRFREVLIRTGRRALLAVPLMRDEHIIGALAVQRNTPGPFGTEIVELLNTFATQSAMAIQNARLFREIAEKGKQLEVASQHKSQFLASMSHELRTPLNALLGFNEMLLGDVYGEVPGEMQPPLAQMQSSGKHLLRLINNVLDLAKIEAGRMELALADYSVQDTVESVRSTLQPLAADKGLEFVAAVPADIPLAYGDGGRITQCLMNLAGNALKFTKAGKVQISVAMNDHQLRYCVADTGIGIPADKIEGLFTEFKQTDATVASEYGGTGLGLSISKKFVEMHGGRIWAQSEPGKGSVFGFEIPLRAGAT